MRPEPQFKGANTLAHRLERTLRALALFKDERLYPEKYYVPLSTEAAVEAEVRAAFWSPFMRVRKRRDQSSVLERSMYFNKIENVEEADRVEGIKSFALQVLYA